MKVDRVITLKSNAKLYDLYWDVASILQTTE